MRSLHIVQWRPRVVSRFSIRTLFHLLFESAMPYHGIWQTVAADSGGRRCLFPLWKSNPSDDEKSVVIVATLVCTLTALVVTSLRMFVRVKFIRNFGGM